MSLGEGWKGAIGRNGEAIAVLGYWMALIVSIYQEFTAHCIFQQSMSERDKDEPLPPASLAIPAQAKLCYLGHADTF